MDKNSAISATIDKYIAQQPQSVQELLQKIRSTIQKAAPTAEETIKYDIPTFTLNGNLVHFGAYKKHIGLYPAPSGMVAFKIELAAYETGKGSIQFPMSKPLPYKLIEEIVQYRVKENLKKAVKKSTKMK